MTEGRTSPSSTHTQQIASKTRRRTPSALRVAHPERASLQAPLTGASLLSRVGGGRLLFFSVDQAELFHLVAQRVAADVQQLGGLDLVAVGLLQCHLDQRMLDVFQRSSALG